MLDGSLPAWRAMETTTQTDAIDTASARNFVPMPPIARAADRRGRIRAKASGWCGYLRVSDQRQAANGDGLGSQQASIEKWAIEAGVEVTVWESDIAPGTMEALPRREGFARALGHVKAGTCAGIVVARLDRLARDLHTQEFLLLDCGRWGGVASAIAEESRVLESGDDPQRVLIRQLFGAFAQYERAMLKVRLQAGRVNRKEQGKWHGGTVPFGFRVEEGTERLIPDPFESSIIRKGLNLRERGVTLADIGEYFSEAGLQLKRSTHWRPEQVKRTLDMHRKYGLDSLPLDELSARFLS